MPADQREIQAQIAELKNIRILLEEAWMHARNIENPEGESLAHLLRGALRKTNCHIHDLRRIDRASPYVSKRPAK